MIVLSSLLTDMYPVWIASEPVGERSDHDGFGQCSSPVVVAVAVACSSSLNPVREKEELFSSSL